MKKIISLLLFIIIFSFNINSQVIEKNASLKNEFSLSYGFASSQEFIDILTELIHSIFTFTDGEVKRSGFGGPIIFGYKRIFDNIIGVGISGLYSSYNTEFIKHSDNSILYSTTNKYYAVILKSDIYYVTNEWVQMYSGFSIGAISENSTLKVVNDPQIHYTSQVAPAFQLNLYSLRVGKKFGGYFELGYGCNGILNLGGTYKF